MAVVVHMGIQQILHLAEDLLIMISIIKSLQYNFINPQWQFQIVLILVYIEIHMLK